MSNNSLPTKTTYRDSVMTWGNQSPWKRLGVRLSHKVSFKPEDVIRDGCGNILSMPCLTRKPCFGRPEAVFRHGKRTQKLKSRNGNIVDSDKHQCGSCPVGVHKACVQTAHERVLSDPNMLQSFRAWWHYCVTYNNGTLICTGPASLLWGAFKRAVAERGPFDSSNDAVVVKQAAAKLQIQREKWKKQKRLQRQIDRERAQQERQLPSVQFLINLVDERDRRFDALLEVLGKAGQPPRRAKVQADKCEATAIITANAWAVRAVLEASGQVATSCKVASLIAKHNLGAGVAAPTLKTRMKNDLKRADECEQDGLWKRFDPDSDLENNETMDDDAADELSDPVNEIGLILRGLNSDNFN